MRVYRQRESEFANLVGSAIDDPSRVVGLPHNTRGVSGSVWHACSIHQSNGNLTQMATDGSVRLPLFGCGDAHTLTTFLTTQNKPLLPGADNVAVHQGASHLVAVSTNKRGRPTSGRQLGGYTDCRQHRQRAVHAGHASCTHRSAPTVDHLPARTPHELRNSRPRAVVRNDKLDPLPVFVPSRGRRAPTESAQNSTEQAVLQVLAPGIRPLSLVG